MKKLTPWFIALLVTNALWAATLMRFTGPARRSRVYQQQDYNSHVQVQIIE